MNAEPRGVVARLAVASARRPWIALTAWALLVGLAVATALVGVTGETLFNRLVSGAPVASTSESALADDLLAGVDEGNVTTTFLVHGVDLADPAVVDIGVRLTDAVDGIPGVEVVDPLAVPVLPDGSRMPAVASLFAADDAADDFLALL